MNRDISMTTTRELVGEFLVNNLQATGDRKIITNGEWLGQFAQWFKKQTKYNKLNPSTSEVIAEMGVFLRDSKALGYGWLESSLKSGIYDIVGARLVDIDMVTQYMGSGVTPKGFPETLRDFR